MSRFELCFTSHLARPGRAVFPAAALLLAAGCAQPDRSITPEPGAVVAALAPPSFERIELAASKIKHPLLRPLVIDGRNGFSPDEIAVMVVLASPQLRALRDQRGVAQAQVLQAGILPNPQLGYSLDRPHGNVDPTLVTGKVLGLSWDVTSLLGRQDRVAGARATADALDLDIAWQEWQAAEGARLSAFRLLALRQRLPLVREIEAELAGRVDAIKQAFALGHMTAVDLTATTDQWVAAQNSRFAAEQEYRTEHSALNLALGLPADYELALRPAEEISALPAETTPAALLDGLELRRLDLVALTLGYESNEAGLRAAVKARFPRIGLSIAKANDTSDVRTRTYGVTIDLPLFDRNQGAIAAGEATRHQLFDEYVARVAEARAEVALIFANLAAARTQLQAATAEMPGWEKLVASYAEAFQARNVEAATYHDARAALATHRLEQANLRQQVRELEVALEIATGRPLLNVPPSPTLP